MTNLIKITSETQAGLTFLLDTSRVKTIDNIVFSVETAMHRGVKVAESGDLGIRIRHADGLDTYHSGFSVDDVFNSMQSQAERTTLVVTSELADLIKWATQTGHLEIKTNTHGAHVSLFIYDPDPKVDSITIEGDMAGVDVPDALTRGLKDVRRQWETQQSA